MVVLPAPEGPTSAVVVPGATRKLTSLRPTERAVCWKPTCSNTSVGALRRARRQVAGVGRVGDLRLDRAQVEHLLHVDERLADHAVVDAEDAERRIDRLQDQDAGGDAAGRHLAVDHLEAGQQR